MERWHHVVPTAHEAHVVLALSHPGEPLGLDLEERGDCVLVLRIRGDSAAERAGLQPPFILRALGGSPVRTEQDVRELVGGIRQQGAGEVPVVIQPCRVGPTEAHVIHLQSPTEPVGLQFRDEADGTVRVHGVCAAAERAGVPAGEHVVLRRVCATRVTRAEEVAPLVRAVKERGELAIPVEVTLMVEGELGGTPTAGSVGADPGGDGTAVPNMPMFEPASDPAANMLMEKAGEMDIAGAQGTNAKFTFPADVCFWDNFCLQAQLSKGAQEGQLFQVSASHDSDNQLKVNQGFLRKFVRGWEEANPHTVTLEGPDGVKTFHASKEFWADVVERLRNTGGPPPPPGEGVQIRSNLCDGMPAVVASARDWNRACSKWEEEKGTTQEQRQQLIAVRRAQVEEKKRIEAEQERAPRRRSRQLGDLLPPPPLRPAPAPPPAAAPAPPPPAVRDAATQCAAPPARADRPVFRSNLPPAPPQQNARPPFSSAPPAPRQCAAVCPACGSPRRGGADGGGEQRWPAPVPAWVYLLPQPQGQRAERGVRGSPSAPPWAAEWAEPPPPPLAWQQQQQQQQRQQWGPPQQPQWAPPPAAPGAVCPSAQRAAQGGLRHWVNFVKEWEGVARGDRTADPFGFLDPRGL